MHFWQHEFAGSGSSSISSPFQTKIFPLAPLSRMKQSSRTSVSFANGLFSDTLVIVMEPVASDTCWVNVHSLMLCLIKTRCKRQFYISVRFLKPCRWGHLVEGRSIWNVRFAVLFWRALCQRWHRSQDLPRNIRGSSENRNTTSSFQDSALLKEEFHNMGNLLISFLAES